MQFTRLRLSGFKSFVDAAEFRIEPGLTGVVGPNGCGKSNLLEAMRWVMGAASAKAMRGEGMDDVIFTGSADRPSRNHAEVTLSIDNAEGGAPSAFAAEPELEVTRRIDRGEGSTYRVNGREVRARDVQILFADASTGANSPALVRQGQISELIAAKPQNRRRVLEEAAGVTGLYGRRHEAELRVAAAQANLERLDDVARELEASLAKLKREARAAARYKALGADIRALQASLVRHRWLDARAAARSAGDEAERSQTTLEVAVRASAAAVARALQADAAIRPLREDEAAATAVVARLTIEKDRLDRDLELAAETARRLGDELERIAADDAREAERSADAGAAVARLDAAILALESEMAAAPRRTPELAATFEAAEGTRRVAEAELESVAARAAAVEAARGAARSRLAEAEARAVRILASLAAAETELAGLAPPDAEAADGALRSASARMEGARAALGVAEAAVAAARASEAAARATARAAADEVAGATTESAGLARLTASGGDEYPAVFHKVTPRPGLEAALAAALGEDLDAALDSRAPAHWAAAPQPSAPAWPKGVTPLADLVDAPAELNARLAFTGLVDRRDGAKLSERLAPGMRLVSREGDLWRWDGYVAAATAPRPAQARLEHRARLRVLEARIVELAPAADAAEKAHTAAVRELGAVESALRAARVEVATAETTLTGAREISERLARDAARRDARAAFLGETVERLESEFGEARNLAANLTAELAAGEPDAASAERLGAARTAAGAARERAATAYAALERERRDGEARVARRQTLAAESGAWEVRRAAAARRGVELVAERERTQTALAEALAAPEKAQGRIGDLIDQLAAAEARKGGCADAVAAAETARADADRQARAAEAAAADAREARAGDLARLEAADERLADHARALAETLGVTTEDLEREHGAEADDDQSAPGDAEVRLAQLERERDQMGAVNLRAEEEVAELSDRVISLTTERADLAGALGRLRQAIGELNSKGRERLLSAFEVIDRHFRELFTILFQGGQAELRLVESDDPLEAGLEVYACPPGKRLAVMSLMSGGEQAMTAVALIFAIFLANPAPVCVLDEVDAPLDDANVERFCNLLASMRGRASTRFIVITHNPLTMSRMDRLYGVTMRERGVSQLVSVDLHQAEAMAAQ